MALSLLGRILDIEWLIERDRGRTEDELRAHDRRLLEGPTRDPEGALARWLEGRRAELEGRTPGLWTSEALGVLHVALIVVSLAAGAGAARALLHGATSGAPTNVLHFTFATLGWPLVFLIGSLLAFLARGRLSRSVLLALVYGAVLGVVGRWLRRHGHEDWDLAHEWRKLRRGERRYRDLVVPALVSAGQWYPLAFHLGAAAVLVLSALFTDLAFGWSTTDASLSPEALAAFFGVVTAPFCVPFDVGCTSAELVRATQFSRFSGQYALPHGGAVSGGWWPVLALTLLVYGVLPRLVFALGSAAVVSRRAAHLSERVLELRSRLSAGVDVIPRRSHPQPDGAEPAREGGERELEPQRRERPCWVIRWRGAELGASGEGALCARLALRAVRRDTAGNGDFGQDAALLETGGPSASAVVLIVDGWEAPDKATRRFVQALRTAAPERPVFVGVLGTPGQAEQQLELWRDRLRLLEDPGVVVERCESELDAAGAASELSS